MNNDLRVELRFKNAVLGRALTEQFGEIAKGVQSGPMLPLIKVSSASIGVSGSYLSALLNLRGSPWNEKGTRLPYASIIASALGIDFDELFPAALYSGKFSSARVAEIPSSRLLPLSQALRIPSSIDIQADYESQEQAEIIKETLRTLTPRQEKILEMRFGLDDRGEHTREEIAERFGLTAERISQIEAQALKKLRHPGVAQKLIAAGAHA